MPLDAATLQDTMNQLKTNLDEVNKGLELRANEITRLQTEMQQHLGAKSYIQAMIGRLQQQLAETTSP